MSLHKSHRVVRTDNLKDVLEEFASAEAAEQFLIMMQAKGEDVMIVTDDEEADENATPDEFIIEGLELDEPSVEFGSELDDEFGLFDQDDKDGDIEFD
jgi:hypothetical protein